MDIENKILTVNGQKYLVMETVEYNNKKYAYLINKNNELDAMFREVIVDNGLKLSNIDSDFFEKQIYPLFVEKFKNY